MNNSESQPPDGFEVKQDEEDSGVWLWKRVEWTRWRSASPDRDTALEACWVLYNARAV
jgi:hypothetical protein